MGRFGEGALGFDSGVGDGPEVTLHQGQGLIGIGVAGDDHRHVPRVVMAAVIAAAVLQSEVVQILVPADHRPLVGMLGIGGGKELLFHQPQGAVDAPEFAFADHHLQFRREGIVIQLQIEQAVGL